MKLLLKNYQQLRLFTVSGPRRPSLMDCNSGSMATGAVEGLSRECNDGVRVGEGSCSPGGNNVDVFSACQGGWNNTGPRPGNSCSSGKGVNYSDGWCEGGDAVTDLGIDCYGGDNIRNGSCNINGAGLKMEPCPTTGMGLVPPPGCTSGTEG